ncbi:hypothetical protein CS8_094130 [Cupriavidus sp. 8B]
MPCDADAVGPQTEAECGRYELIMEGLNRGPGTDYESEACDDNELGAADL